MRPCIPPEIKRAAEAAERRRDEAIAKLLRELHPVPADDDFTRQMHALIDADERKDR